MVPEVFHCSLDQTIWFLGKIGVVFELWARKLLSTRHSALMGCFVGVWKTKILGTVYNGNLAYEVIEKIMAISELLT